MTPVQRRPASELERFYRQRLAWSDCKDGFQCATLKVPRDYAKPSGPEFGIAVIRLAASDPSRRIGSLVTNPGGPGESGVTFIHMNGRSFGDALRARFDLVGFDPRGVGRSDPVHCSASPEVVHRIYADPPQTPTEISAQVATVKTYVAGCEARSGAELPYVGTVSAARDMDVLRAVLGDQRLTYLGFSYGTYLGATYAGLFPTHVRALALDGAEDPKKTAAQEDLEQARGFETALRSFAADCVKTPGCPLGDASVDAALAKVTELQEQARRRPLTNRAGNHRPVDEDGVTEGITAALYSRDTWPGLRLAFAQALKNGDGTAFVALAGALGPLSAARDVDESEGALFAVDCVDRPYPATVEAIRAEAAEAKKIAPHFGASIVWPSLVCSFWPVKNTRQPTPVRAAGAPPILVVGTTRDPATPYGWAQGLAAELTSGVLLTYNGDGHTAFLQGNACIDDAVENYLIDLRVPEPGTVCEQQVPETGEQAKSHPS
jgi:pimeloyl-ACP methyl ester carboxylesterase